MRRRSKWSRPTLHFALQLPTDRVVEGAEFVGPVAIAEMARAAGVAGFDAVSVTDHPFPPARDPRRSRREWCERVAAFGKRV